MTTTKLAGGAGIIWALVNLVIGFAAGSPPALDAPAADIRSYVLDNRGLFLALAFVAALTLPLLLAFSATIARQLRSGGERGEVAASVMLIAMTAGAALLALGNVFMLPLALEQSLGAELSDGVVHYLYLAVFAITLVANAAFSSGLIAVGLSGAPMHSAFLKASLGIGAVMLVVSSLGLVNLDIALAGGLGFALFSLWAIWAGVTMLRAGSEATVGHRMVATA